MLYLKLKYALIDTRDFENIQRYIHFLGKKKKPKQNIYFNNLLVEAPIDRSSTSYN